MTTTNRWVRRAGSAIARLDLHRLLRLEPPEFGDHHDQRLRHIEGWRYRQDLALLYSLARDVPGNEAVLEIGSYRGLSTTALALGIRDRPTTTDLHAVDPHTGDRQDLEQSGLGLKPSEAEFRRNIDQAGVADLVTTHVMTSDELADRWDRPPLRVLFIDGWHSYDAVRSDIANFAPLVTASGVVLIDDHLNYEEVRRAVRDSAALLPPHEERAGRMWLGHGGSLPPAVWRLLKVPWG